MKAMHDQDEAKTMPCAMYFYYDNSVVYSKSLLKLFWQFMVVASFSGHFLAPPTWPGNEAGMILTR